VPELRGRGAAANPANRFEALSYAWDEDADPAEKPAPGTVFLRDTSRTIIARNDSPDIPFSASLNPYRGCEHGCIYCYARPTHEYLGFSAGLDFESRILIKEDAAALLEEELAAKSWDPQVIAVSGITDPYQPVERKTLLTRRCLMVLADCRNPLVVITKNALVARDVDVFQELARLGAARVFVSITTLDGELARKMEPRTSTPELRLKAVETLAKAGVPVGVMVAPTIVGLTDHEMPAIIKAAARAGAGSAGYVPLRLPFAVGGLFEEWLERHYPSRKEKVLNQIRSLRGGRLNDSRFGERMRGQGVLAEHLRELFALSCRRAGLERQSPQLSAEHFRRPAGKDQLRLFG
jgi:DNA repair photolyase